MKAELFKPNGSAFILPSSDFILLPSGFILGFQLRVCGGLAYNLSLEHLVMTNLSDERWWLAEKAQSPRLHVTNVTNVTKENSSWLI